MVELDQTIEHLPADLARPEHQVACHVATVPKRPVASRVVGPVLSGQLSRLTPAGGYQSWSV